MKVFRYIFFLSFFLFTYLIVSLLNVIYHFNVVEKITVIGLILIDLHFFKEIYKFWFSLYSFINVCYIYE